MIPHELANYGRTMDNFLEPRQNVLIKHIHVRLGNVGWYVIVGNGVVMVKTLISFFFVLGGGEVYLDISLAMIKLRWIFGFGQMEWVRLHGEVKANHYLGSKEHPQWGPDAQVQQLLALLM